jgi:predicted ATPase
MFMQSELTLLHDLARAGSQAVVATPIVAAVPGATILEPGAWGIRPARWEDLHLAGAWRRFMAEPGSYFRHLLAGDTGE